MLLASRSLLKRLTVCGCFSSKKFNIVQDPKEAPKLVFESDGRCKIYEHKNGEA